MTSSYNSSKLKIQSMKHKIAFTIEGVKSPIEFEIGEETFKKIAQTCQEKYPNKNWKTISDSYK